MQYPGPCKYCKALLHELEPAYTKIVYLYIYWATDTGVWVGRRGLIEKKDRVEGANQIRPFAFEKFIITSGEEN